jgi:hypothetical protein
MLYRRLSALGYAQSMVTTTKSLFYCCFIFVNNNSQSRITQISMITKATAADVSSLNKLINSAYRGEFSKGWTTEANLLEGSRTNEIELIEIIQNPINTI